MCLKLRLLMGFYELMGHIKIQHSNPPAGPRRSSTSIGGGGWKVLGGAIGGAGAWSMDSSGGVECSIWIIRGGEKWEYERWGNKLMFDSIDP